MSVLSGELRKELEDACVRGRRASESAGRAALGSLGVADKQVPRHLDEADRVLRRGLRAKSRQLGDPDSEIELLVADCAYEQWHRLLFARFLAENGLLIHPDYRAPVSLDDCEELAEQLGEPDGWAVAGRFAAEILPGIFRLDDPAVQLSLAPEGRLELERIIAGLPTEMFTASDALGWVYQFWQKEKKDEVNASERKIGGADLGPVTQLFTENYMVRFLLENSLGAWWAARRPDSPLIKDWEYLRLDENGAPAAGSFDGWPDSIAEVTVMDPCCGSGHFLVEAFGMLWQMRAEEEALKPTAAQDAVLRDNLFGLELDPRCVQIAMFAVALAAWKAGDGWRALPVPNVACSGIPVKAPVENWKALANGDPRLENALERLHILFRYADTLGSLIDPRRAVEITDPTGLQSSFDDVDWEGVTPLIGQALAREAEDPATAVLGSDAVGTARAADYLSREYTLIATNVPYLGSSAQEDRLRSYLEANFRSGASDLAAAFLLCWIGRTADRGSVALVMPQAPLYQASYEEMRRNLITGSTWHALARLGPRAFSMITGEVVNVCLLVMSGSTRPGDGEIRGLDVSDRSTPNKKNAALREVPVLAVSQRAQLRHPQARISLVAIDDSALLSKYAKSTQGLKTGDNPRFIQYFWELTSIDGDWEKIQSAVEKTQAWGGRQEVLYWQHGRGHLAGSPQARVQGQQAWGRHGVLVREMGTLPATLYSGDMFQSNGIAVIPNRPDVIEALWACVVSPKFSDGVRKLDAKLGIATASAVAVPFDLEEWDSVAREQFPNGIPEPWSDDPTQWLFEGRPEVATEPLQVAVGRLLGFRWPEQSESDGLDQVVDEDGIVCLPSVLGERTASDRLQELLTRAFGGEWSPAKPCLLLEASGSKKKDLASWLRDDFFKAHCKVFKNRPFVWQIWDGRNDGFSALVNYHRLDRPTLERLTYTYLGDWIERQAAGVRDEVAGAEERLAAARNLQDRLELILEGERSYDIYVRWKSLAEQPMGWDPDLNDGVRLNVRPFVEAGVLRSKFNVKWNKDRGKNPDGSERHNDLHFSLAEKQAARQDAAT